MVKQERVIGKFLELIAIDSETKNERNIADILKKQLSELGLEVVEDDSQSKTGHGAGNIIATLKGDGISKAEPILLTCHMDTVAPGNGIKAIVGEDGWIRSDGTTILGADDKAGLAALFEVIHVIAENKLPHGQIQFVITAGEESGLQGSRALDPKYIDAKMGFAIDSNGEVGTICVAAPTQTRLQIEIFGKSAHAGVNPEDGISAIQVAGKAIARMKLGRISEDTTANISKFEGGGATNVITDHVKLYGEARSLYQDKVEAQLASMKEAMETACQDYGARGEFKTEVFYPAFHLGDDAPVVQLVKQATSKLGLSGETFKSGGGSDANVFNGLGIPTVNLAIGYEDIHTTKERIKQEDIVKITELLLEIINQTVEQA